MIIILTFSSPINESAQVGDTVFAVRNFTTIGGFRQSDLTNTLEIGRIIRDFNPTSQTPGFNNRDGLLNAPIEIYVEKTTSANINPGDYKTYRYLLTKTTSFLLEGTCKREFYEDYINEDHYYNFDRAYE